MSSKHSHFFSKSFNRAFKCFFFNPNPLILLILLAIYAIKNNDCKELNIEKLCLLSSISISSCEEKAYSAIFYIHNENQTEYEQLCEGLGNKIMGVKIVYSAGLEVSNINMCLVGSDYT